MTTSFRIAPPIATREWTILVIERLTVGIDVEASFVGASGQLQVAAVILRRGDSVDCVDALGNPTSLASWLAAVPALSAALQRPA
jgi:hypothetical protein